jgi:hypothetical protein
MHEQLTPGAAPCQDSLSRPRVPCRSSASSRQRPDSQAQARGSSRSRPISSAGSWEHVSFDPAGKDRVGRWAACGRRLDRFRTTQPPYSLPVRGIEFDVLPTLWRHGMGTLTHSPLAGGRLSGSWSAHSSPISPARQRPAARFDMSLPENQRKLEAVEQLAKVADEAGASLIELAIAFVVNHPAVTSAIIGPRTAEQLDSQTLAANLTLDPPIVDRIDEIVQPGVNLNPADTSYGEQILRPTLRRRQTALSDSSSRRHGAPPRADFHADVGEKPDSAGVPLAGRRELLLRPTHTPQARQHRGARRHDQRSRSLRRPPHRAGRPLPDTYQKTVARNAENDKPTPVRRSRTPCLDRAIRHRPGGQWHMERQSSDDHVDFRRERRFHRQDDLSPRDLSDEWLGANRARYAALCPGAILGEGLAIRGEEVRHSREAVESWLARIDLARG